MNLPASLYFGVLGVNIGAATLQMVLANKYRRRLKELTNGNRQSSARVGSGTGAVHAAASGERAGGASTPEAGNASLSPVPVAEEILAWRGWDAAARPDGYGGWEIILVGRYGAEWHGPTLTADRAPAEDNENGVYARPLDYYQRIMSTPFGIPFHPNPSAVQGKVALSGRVLQGERGWRAERCAIRELWVLGNIAGPPPLLVQALLEQRYKCDVHIGVPVEFNAWMYA